MLEIGEKGGCKGQKRKDQVMSIERKGKKEGENRREKKWEYRSFIEKYIS